MLESEEGRVETATSTKGLLPVELTIHDHYGRETQCAFTGCPLLWDAMRAQMCS